MLKKVMAIIALVLFVLLMLDVFVFQYALEFVLPIYIIVMIVGMIFTVFSRTSEATDKVRELKEKVDSPDQDDNENFDATGADS